MEAEKRLLKIGDKLYMTRYRYGKESIPEFASVVRLTPTQAILSNGIRLKNEPKYSSFKGELFFSVIGESYDGWYFETPEIVEKAKRLNEELRIRRWFESKKWNIEEMKLLKKRIYYNYEE